MTPTVEPVLGAEGAHVACDIAAAAGRLEQAFREVQHERMTNVPLLNTALSIEAIGFRQWQDGVLGVLLTPWFMSVMLLPGVDDLPSNGVVGERRQCAFPSGCYEFIRGWHAAVGWYESCSLFSPVFEFSSQDEARAVALAALDALLDPHGGHDARQAGEISAVQTPAGRRMSRRDLLRGALFRERAESRRD